MICYVDTQIAVWLAAANLARLSQKALSLLQLADVRISPMAVMELEYLYEIGRILVKPQELVLKLNTEIGLTICDHPFPPSSKWRWEKPGRETLSTASSSPMQRPMAFRHY